MRERFVISSPPNRAIDGKKVKINIDKRP